MLWWVRDRAQQRLADRHAASAHLVIVPQDSERQLLDERLGIAAKTEVIPFGLSDERLEAFARSAAAPKSRLDAQTVAFVGSWTPRKGSRDLPEIVERVHRALPDTSFRLLGTGTPEDTVREAFAPAAQSRIEIISGFRSDELPTLLKDVTVSVLPSYVEGFGFAILESWASGAPVAAYDAPGPDELLRGGRGGILVRVGDRRALADALITVLSLTPAIYSDRSQEAIKLARGYRWAEIALRTSGAYQAAASPTRPAASPTAAVASA
jgi:glycosyltransferase involved in cell wall biosynthesis